MVNAGVYKGPENTYYCNNYRQNSNFSKNACEFVRAEMGYFEFYYERLLPILTVANLCGN
jgi:hypothetical protein